MKNKVCKMYLTTKQQLKRMSKSEFLVLKDLTHIAKNLINQALYNVRQHYFNTGKYLSYEENYKLLKTSENYKKLNSNMAQQLIKQVDEMFKSFFALKKLEKEGKYDQPIHIPRYLDKKGFTTLSIGFVRLKGDSFDLPFSQSYKKEHNIINIKLPKNILGKQIKEIRIIPKYEARFFEVQYTYTVESTPKKLNKKNALAIDSGINNFATCVTNTGKTFIIDGKNLKSTNQWFNKRNAQLQSLKDKQEYGKKLTKQQKSIWNNRNNAINDFISKTAKHIIDYCVKNDIGNIVLGYNSEFQNGSNLGKRNNQNFVNIPFGKLKEKLEYLSKLNGIKLHIQEESYTSKASFFDKDEIPVYKKGDKEKHTFSGKRISRGLYKTSKGKVLNADVNGALNILSKSKVVGLTALYRRGEVDTPVRIRIA